MTKPRTKKADPVAELSERMLLVLESQRTLGGDAYPPTLGRLVELCDGNASPDQVIKAVGKKTFTAKATATIGAGKQPIFDAPVYFNEDRPKPEEVLATRMVLVLESQRSLKDDSYPPTLRRLAELCERKGSDTLVPKVASQLTLADRVVVLAEKPKGKPSLDAPIVLKEDIKEGLSGVLPALLRFALSPVTTTVKKKPVESTAFTVAELKKRVGIAWQDAFEAAVDQGIERQGLPTDVAWVMVKGAPLLFLLEHLRPGAPLHSHPVDGHAAPPLAASDGSTAALPERPARDFAEAFRAAFDRLDRRNGSTNFVKLSDLRRELPEFDRAAFDAGLRALRVATLFTLDSHEGLVGSLTPEERDAGVIDGGSVLIYASRR